VGRYSQIQSVTFGQTSLPLPISVKIFRSGDAKAAGSDSDLFQTSVELAQKPIAAEVRIRGTATAEALFLGQQGNLSFDVVAAEGNGSARTITLADAVLTAVELSYEQAAMAIALLKFVAEAADGSQEPFSAEDAQ